MTGLFAVIPFRDSLPRIAYVSPFIGLMIYALGLSSAYLAGINLHTASILILCVSSLITVLACCFTGFRPFLNITWIEAVFCVAVIGLLAFLIDHATITAHTPAVLYMDGTDHLGYAHVADWLRMHPRSIAPVVDSFIPYQSWPAYMFAIDPRFGAYYLLTLASIVRSVPATFAYDFSCTVVLSSAVFGVAGAFAFKRSSFLLAVAGLFLSAWFDYSRGGYFGKILGYPAVLILIGLLLAWRKKDSSLPVFLLIAVFSVATSILHSGMATAVLLFSFGLAEAIPLQVFNFKESFKVFFMRSTEIGFLIFLSLTAAGILSRPAPAAGIPDYGLNWRYILTRVLDLNNQGVDLVGSSRLKIGLLVFVAILAHSVLLFLAVRKKNKPAVGLLAGLPIILVILWVTHRDAIAFQFIGIVFPMAICGAILLLDEARTKILFTFTLASLLLLIVVRIPRFEGSVMRYAISPPATAIYKLSDFDQIEAHVGTSNLEVDMNSPNPAIAALVELGRRFPHLQWSEAGWNTVVRYRQWPHPVYPERARFVLQGRDSQKTPQSDLVFETPEYKLYRRQ